MNTFYTRLWMCLTLFCCIQFLNAQTLVEDDDVPGMLIAEGYDLSLMVDGLNFPSNIALGPDGQIWVTEAGGFPDLPPALKQINIDANGQATATTVLAPNMMPPGMLAGPFTDVHFWNGMVWLSHRQTGANGWTVGALSRFNATDPVGTFETVLTNLPSTGDHSNNVVVFGADGRGYIGLGSATNSGVVGADNVLRWVPDAPGFAEIAPVDITFRPNGYTARIPTELDPGSNAVTAAYRAFDTGAETEAYTVPAATFDNPTNGIIAGSGTVYSFDPMADNAMSTMRLEAWGLRNPFGLGFDAEDDSRLFISNNGSDIRGQATDPNDPLNPAKFEIQGNRPIANDHDEMFVITVGGEAEFFGWPDFLHDPNTNEVLDANDPLFCNSPALDDSDCSELLFDEDFRNGLDVEEAFANVGPYVSVTGFVANDNADFGLENYLFVTESGSFSPQTGAFSFTGYRVSLFDNQSGEKRDFVVNEGSTAEELFVPTKLNKPVQTMFMGDRLLIVDLGVLEPGINMAMPGTGKVWIVSRSADPQEPTDLQAGRISTEDGATTLDICSGDGIPDVVRFVSDRDDDDDDDDVSFFVYVLVNNNNRVIDFLAGDQIEFEGSPTEQCRLFGLAFTGDLLLTRGMDINTTPASTGESALSENFVQVNIQRGGCMGGMFKNDTPQNGLVTPTPSADLLETDQSSATPAFRTNGGANGQWSVFPNPAHQEVTIQLGNRYPEATDVQLVDPVGRVVETRLLDQAAESTVRFNVETVDAGLYQVRLRANSSVLVTEKIMIVK